MKKRRKTKSVDVKVYVSRKQKEILKAIRAESRCSYSELLRRALYAEYPQLGNTD